MHLKRILIGTAVLCIASAGIHPFGAVKREDSNRALLSAARIDAEIMSMLVRSCQTCHSQRTVWPWYSYVAPVSWLIERDVSKARAYMNFSRWEEYTNEEREVYLGAIAAAIRNKQMPPSRFALLHPESRLSTAESERIYLWARGERRRLRTPVPASAAYAHYP